MKSFFLLLSFAVVGSSAHAQEAASASNAAPPRVMAACESVIKSGAASQNWLTTPIPYSTVGKGGWGGNKRTFQPPVPGMTASSAAAVDGTFAMWSGKGVNVVYAAYEANPAAVDDVIYFRCKANPSSGAVISVIERGAAQASADEANE